MAFVMIATGATSRSRVRTLSVRPLVAAAGLAALALLGSGGAVGYWVAEFATRQAAPIAAAASQRPAGAAVHARAGRRDLGSAVPSRERGGAAEQAHRRARQGERGDAARAPRRRPDETPAPTPAGASGGPWLAPHADAAEGGALAVLDAQLGRIEQQIAGVASVAAQRSLEQMRLPTRLPIAGAELTSGFGNRVDPFAHSHAFHAGLDFAAPIGTPIASAAGGVVAFAGFKRDYGWVVEIDHGNGLVTRYAHASELLVQPGQVVIPGDRIAIVGSTGRSTGPHLHFEVLRAGDHVDPKRYLAGL